jgi:hypothetical protein
VHGETISMEYIQGKEGLTQQNAWQAGKEPLNHIQIVLKSAQQAANEQPPDS